jgi:Peptidase family M1 domain
VTQVTTFTLGQSLFLALILIGIGPAQPYAPPAIGGHGSRQASSSPASKPAEALYLRLRSVGLDPTLTFRVRGASIDRSALHVTLEDGEISFTTTIDGHVTGAFFEGDGEVLLTPPNQVERASMTLFTGMAILEERIASAYLRFNDQTFSELQPYLRPADDPKAFASRWDEAARNLADADALRLLGMFSHSLPVKGKSSPETKQPNEKQNEAADRFLHVRLQGQKLGTFDVGFDSITTEQIWAGQTQTKEGVTFYNLWTSFAPNPQRLSSGQPQGLEQANDDLQVSDYKIRVDVKPPTTVNADAELKLDVRRGGARTVLFELSRFLQVHQVEVNGEPVEFINNTALDGTQLARRGNDLVAVIFPADLQSGQTITMRFTYGGDVLSDAGGGLLYVGARGAWYPNRGLQMANFDLEFHYPTNWTLVATGRRRDVVPSSGSNSPAQVSGGQVTRWVTERPCTLSGFNLGKYERVRVQTSDVNVSVYASKGVERTFPHGSEEITVMPDARLGHPRLGTMLSTAETPSPARNAQIVADHAVRAVDFFSKRFGPYPYSSLDLTQMPGHLSQGWPGLVFLTSLSFLTPGEETDLHLNPGQEIFNRLVLPHEIAHQWWGDLVGWHSYRDQWIVEALANYSALMMLETQNPLDFRKAMDRYRDDLLRKNKDGEELFTAGPVTLGQRLNSSHFPDGYEAICYGRGTWLFHMLRHMLLDAEAEQLRGKSKPTEEPFIRTLRLMRERYAGKEITTAELLGLFEKSLPSSLHYEGKKSLRWFFESWIEGVSLPHFALQNVKYIAKPGGTLVSGTIVETDAPESLVTAVPVYESVSSRTTLLGTVFVDSRATPFHIMAPPGTRKVSLDANQTLLTSPK